ncbi:MAG: peptidoglycan DD-metalloendopeptidase family protein [Actinomycetota bacterium]
MPAAPARSSLSVAVSLATLLVATALGSAPTVSAMNERAERGKGERLESADWLPFRGRIRITRTWGHRGGHAFPAIDFEVPSGTSVPIYAAGPGTVIQATEDCPDTTEDGAHTDCNEGKGNFVEITHPDGRRSRYQHLRQASVTVSVGDHVCRGCRIGRSGWSGNVSPPGPDGGHLHYEELESFVTVDPGRMLAQHRNRRVSYPGAGRSWIRVGKKGLNVRNIRFPRSDPGPIVDCRGWAATWIGTAGHDQLVGTEGPDIMAGLGGDDSIRGTDGDDRICGGPGDDTLIGGANEDLLDGGEGTDTCFAEEDDGSKRPGGETLLSCEGPPYILSVEVGCCVRFVTSEPAGISCPPDCSEAYLPGIVVKLTLSTGSARWYGCDQESLGQTCLVTMSADRHVRV